MSRTFLALALLSIGVASGPGVVLGDPVPRNTEETTSEQGVATSETCSLGEPPAEPKKRKALAPIVEKGLREGIEFAKVGDVSLTLDAFVPEGDGPFPACILVHGGGFMRGDKQTYIALVVRTAQQGLGSRLVHDRPLTGSLRSTAGPPVPRTSTRRIRWVKAHAK